MVKNIVQIGFTVVIFLMLIMVGAVLYQTNSTNTTISNLVEISNAKIEYAHTMRDAIRRRQNSLISLVMFDDPFDLDNEIVRFYSYAVDYRTARASLLALPMDSKEEELHTRLTEITNKTQPLVQHAAELLVTGAPIDKTKAAVYTAINSQTTVFSILDELVAMQKQQGVFTATNSRATFDNLVWLISIISCIAIILAFTIAYYVSRFVTEKNKQLFESNINLAKAYYHSEEATRTKTAFLANMSHEIRTPLTAIIGFAELLQQGNQSREDEITSIKTITRSGKHLLTVINEILDVSKIEAHKIHIEKIEVPLFEILQDIESLISGQAERKNIIFKLDYQFPLPQFIISDAVRLKQILINLCNNAVKFTHEGSVCLIVNCDTQNNNIVFAVTDTGIGIAKEKLSLLFNPFSQADTSTTREYGGTGLGLYLSKQLTEMLGGSLDFDSKLGAGSTFIVSIPTGLADDVELIRSESEIPQAHQVETTSEIIRLDSVDILLAEDNKDNQRLFSLYLSSAGANITIVENGEEALDIIKSRDFDIVLMDMQMPVMGGMDAVSRLRANGVDLPVIALTANAMKQAREECLRAGCNDFVTKPVEIDRLFRIISKYVPVSPSEQAPEAIRSILDSEQGKRVVKKFIDSLSKTQSEIDDALDKRDLHQLKDIFHQLKGIGGGVGFPMITQLSKEIEAPIEQQDYMAIKDKTDEFKAMCRQIISGNE